MNSDKTKFKPFDPFSFSSNLLNNINSNWFMITAGNLDSYNMMTASWGMFGILWNKPVAEIFVRNTRYTHNFLEKNDYFSLSFFDENYRNILDLVGSKSGKDFNKMAIKNLTALDYENRTVYFEEANEVLICKKLLAYPLHKDLLPEQIKKNFYDTVNEEHHTAFYGEIIQYLKKI